MTIQADLPLKDYLALPELSGSDLVELGKSPLRYQWRKENPPEPTDPMLQGSAIHTAVLEPEKFKDRYACYAGRRDKRIKEYQEFLEENEGKEVLTKSQWTRALAVGKTLNERMNHLALLVGEAQNELTVTWTDQGIGLKGRPDRLVGRVVVELKSTRSCLPFDFARTIASLKYHVKAALVWDGLVANGITPKAYFFVVFEQEEPFSSAIYLLETDAIQKGRDEYQFLLGVYRRCLEAQEWPDRSSIVMPIGLPKWYEADVGGLMQ